MTIKNFTIENPSNDINNQIRLAKVENSGIRESTINGDEADATVIHWDGIDPIHFGLEGYSKIKLSCFDNGKGMTKEVLERVTEFSSAFGKQMGTKGNKGKGDKLSWMKVNQKGLVWISNAWCEIAKRYRTHRIVMVGDLDKEQWGKQMFDVETDQFEGLVQCVEITDIIEWEELPPHFQQDKSWTLKIYCGNSKNQNTVKRPYDPAQEKKAGWVTKELNKRFPTSLPGKDIFVGVTHKWLNSDKVKFVPVYDVLKKFSGAKSKGKIEYETITLSKQNPSDVSKIKSLGKVFPFFTHDDEVNITYVWDDYAPVTPGTSNDQKSSSWYYARMGTTGTFSGVIHQAHKPGSRPELYDYKGPLDVVGGNNWRQTAPQVGIPAGYKKFRIFVWVADSDEIANDENRTKLVKINQADLEEVELLTYQEHILCGMPEWIKTKIKQETPGTMSLDDMQKKLNEKMKERRAYIKAIRQLGATGEGLPLIPHKPMECPDCKQKGVVSILRRYKIDGTRYRVCPTCSYQKKIKAQDSDHKKKLFTGLIEDPNGKSKMIKEFPEIRKLKNADEWKGLPVVEDFSKMAGQYMDIDNILYINLTFPAFRNFENVLIEGTPDKKESCKKMAERVIILNCIGEMLINAIVQCQQDGFRDTKTFKHLTDPKNISVMANSYMITEVGGIAKSLLRTEPSDSKISLPEATILDPNSKVQLETDVVQKFVAVGGVPPIKQ